MTSRTKWYWVIEITKGFDTVLRKRLPGNLSTQEIGIILQRLVSRHLSPMDVIAASIRKPRRTSLLEFDVSSPPHGKRTMVWFPLFSDYKASHWREDELADYPEILPEE